VHTHSQHFVSDKNGRHVEEGCKTTAGERYLYMDDAIMKMLLEYRQKSLCYAVSNKDWNYRDLRKKKVLQK
jgi:hypothetical protein